MTLLNISGLSHHYAHGGFNGKHQHQAVLNLCLIQISDPTRTISMK